MLNSMRATQVIQGRSLYFGLLQEQLCETGGVINPPGQPALCSVYFLLNTFQMYYPKLLNKMFSFSTKKYFRRYFPNNNKENGAGSCYV